MSSSTALAKRNADTALMPPPPPPTKRQKRPRQVLDEDIYHDAVSHIVARDFFPGLLQSDAQHEYMKALESNNNDWIRDAGRKLVQIMTPVPGGHRRRGRGTNLTPRHSMAGSETPRNFHDETPKRTPLSTSSHFAPEEGPIVDTEMSLGAFQATYTSEDNESFNALLDRQNEKRANKYGFFHQGNNIPSARQIAYRARERQMLESGGTSTALVRPAEARAGDSSSLAIGRLSEDLDARPASIDSFPDRQGPRNHLMFGPDGVEDVLPTPAQDAEQRSNAPPKAVIYDATRFSVPSRTPTEAVPASPSMSAIDAAIAGRPRPTDSESGYAGAETPRVNGYAFVDAEPTPSEMGMPVDDEEADAAEQQAAMKLLPELESGGSNPFKLREQSKREDIHHRLVQKADAARRKEKGGGRLGHLRALGVTPSAKTPTSRFSSTPSSAATGRRDDMTPAAKRLAERIGTPRRENWAFASSGMAKKPPSWTPTPRTAKRSM